MQRNHSSGFTIIELSIVMMIFGLISTTIFYALSQYSSTTIRGHTDEALATSRSAILEFYAYEDRYPCPANPDLGPNDPLYGIEQCTLPSATITVAPGQRDIDGDGTAESVMIGSMPFKTLLDPDDDINTDDGITSTLLSESLTLDGQGQKLRYAVTASLTNVISFNQTEGVIDVVDENDKSVLGLPQTAHFVIVSSGENGEGGYARGGEKVGSCATTIPIDDPGLPPPTFKKTETENCDDADGKFLSGLRNEQERYRNDDKILIGMTNTSSHWQYLTPTSIVNTNAGYVGFGITEPKETLHVLGDIKATKMQAEEFCSPTGSDKVCMPTSIIAGNEAAMKCGAIGTAITAIEKNSVTGHCTKVFPNPGSAPVAFIKTCAPGTAIVGISNITGVICEATP